MYYSCQIEMYFSIIPENCQVKCLEMFILETKLLETATFKMCACRRKLLLKFN